MIKKKKDKKIGKIKKKYFQKKINTKFLKNPQKDYFLKK